MTTGPSVRIVWRRGWEKRVLKEPQARRLIYSIAKDAVLPAIIESIPVVTGSYQEHFEASVSTRRSRARDGTAAAKIAWGEPRWHIINYGSVNNPPYRFIDRGVGAAGLRFNG